MRYWMCRWCPCRSNFIRKVLVFFAHTDHPGIRMLPAVQSQATIEFIRIDFGSDIIRMATSKTLQQQAWTFLASDNRGTPNSSKETTHNINHHDQRSKFNQSSLKMTIALCTTRTAKLSDFISVCPWWISKSIIILNWKKESFKMRIMQWHVLTFAGRKGFTLHGGRKGVNFYPNTCFNISGSIYARIIILVSNITFSRSGSSKTMHADTVTLTGDLQTQGHALFSICFNISGSICARIMILVSNITFSRSGSSKKCMPTLWPWHVTFKIKVTHFFQYISQYLRKYMR